jgi:hypothetical protein
VTRRARRLRRRARRRRIAAVSLLAVVVLALVAGFLGVTSSPSSSSPPATSTTTTVAVTASAPRTLPATPGWGVIARTPRGVAVDQRWFTVSGGARVFVMRFRKGATAFHFHVGTEDPPGANGAVPDDTKATVSRSEWRVGVLGVFNGGFKLAAGAGGLSTDGFAAGALRAGVPTVAIDTLGQLTIGTWGADVPVAGHPLIAVRQNLSYLIDRGKISPLIGSISSWGVTVHGPAVARTAVAVTKGGDVLYAVGSPLLPVDLARGLVAAGATRAMEMDINPFWPIAGASSTPMHAPGAYKVNNPYSQHDPSVYSSGWLRDFFVVMAEPPHLKCVVRSPAPVAGRVVPEPPAVDCRAKG